MGGKYVGGQSVEQAVIDERHREAFIKSKRWQCRKGNIEPADFNLHGTSDKPYVVGVSSERDTPIEVVGQAIMQGLDAYAIDIQHVACVVAIHAKAYDPAFTVFAEVHKVPLVTCSVQCLKWLADDMARDQQINTLVTESWFNLEELSRLSALFISGTRRLIAPPFWYRILPNKPHVIVSISTIGHISAKL